MEDAKKKTLTSVYPTIHTINEMNNIIEKYLKKTTTPYALYGGTAINILLKEKGVHLKTDEQEKLSPADYDMYSSNYLKVSVEIANKLNEDFKYVRRVNAMNPDTVRVGAEFASEFVADITYMPSIAFNKIPKYISEKDKLNIIDPQFLKIDLYASVTRPHTNVFRWEKSYRRLYYMEREYPIPQTDKPHSPKNQTLPNEQVLKAKNKLMKIIIKTKNTLLTDLIAYNLFMQHVPTAILPTKSLIIEVAVPDALHFARKLQKNKLISKFTQHNPYLNILPRHYKLYFEETHIATIYEIGFDGIVPTIIDKVQCFNYHYLLKHLYAKYNIVDDKQPYQYAIQELIKHATLKHPFDIFQTHPIISANPRGQTLAPIKRSFYEFLAQLPQYKPEKNKIDSSKITEIYLDNYFGEEIPPNAEDNISIQLSSFEPEVLDNIDESLLINFID